MFSIRLFHGRHAATDHLTDWGSDGPTLGPLRSVNFTYRSVTLELINESTVELEYVDSLLHYDGVLYGDSEIAEGVSNAVEPTQRKADVRARVRQSAIKVFRLPRRVKLRQQYRAMESVFVDSVRTHFGDEAANAVRVHLSEAVTV